MATMLALELGAFTLFGTLAGTAFLLKLPYPGLLLAVMAAISLIDYIRRVRRRHSQRRQLGSYLRSGHELSDRLPILEPKKLEENMVAWTNEVTAYVKKEFGEAEEERLLLSDGLQGRYSFTEEDKDGTKTTLTAWGFRLQRLLELIDKLPNDYF
jgi:hypothetical protein